MAAERTEEKSSQSGERAVASVLIALLVVMLYGSYREATVRYALDEAYLIKTRNAVTVTALVTKESSEEKTRASYDDDDHVEYIDVVELTRTLEYEVDGEKYEKETSGCVKTYMGGDGKKYADIYVDRGAPITIYEKRETKTKREHFAPVVKDAKEDAPIFAVLIIVIVLTFIVKPKTKTN